MAAQLRPTRLDVTDRFPMLGFTIRTSNPPRVAEVVLATELALFSDKQGRSTSNFYTSREHGLLTVANGEAVYVVPPEVLARFVAADRLYFGLATATPPKADDWTVELLPTANSPYVSLSGLSDRALRRVRMFPARRGSGRYAAGTPAPTLDWAGDHAQPGMVPAGVQAPAAAPAPGNGAPAPANIPYDDGFGPLPPLESEPAAPPAAAPAVPESAPTAQGYSRGLEAEGDDQGLDGPVFDLEGDDAAPQPMALSARPRALTTAEYDGARVMASPAYNAGRSGVTIDRIVIHITGAPQSRWLGSHFTREEANSSAHYMVDQNGAIIQFVREQDTSWHAGNRAANRRSIGIEHVAIQRGGARYTRRNGTVQTFPYTPPTAVEYSTSAGLVAHLCRKYGLTPDRTTIIGHREANPATSHSVCPDGAWDWDAYMALVAAAYTAQAVGGAVSGAVRAVGGAVRSVGDAIGLAHGLEVDPEAMGIDGPAFSEDMPGAVAASALTLGAKEYDRVARIAISPAFTPGRSGQAISRIVIHITDAPTTRSTVNHFTRADANSSAHYLVGQDGEIVQFVSEADTAWHARGANRNSIGIEHVAVKQGGATYGKTTYPHMPPTDIQYSESAALVSHLCDKYGLTPSRTTIIGHREADTGTSHTSCPDGAWNWDHFMDLVTNRVSAPQPAAQGLELASALALTGPEYDRVSRVIPAPATAYASRDGTAIDRIIIHITDAPTTQSTIHRCTDPGAGLSPHYLIGQDGEVLQFVSEADSAQHSGPNGNRRGIGIEHVAIKRGGATYGGQHFPYMPPTDIQYSESAALVTHLCDKYGLPANRTTIVGHSEIAGGTTTHSACPDGAWNWEHYMNLVTNRMSAAQPRGHSLAADAASQAMAADDWTINWDDVQLIAQPSDSSCWATAAAMVDGWKRHQSVSVERIAEFDALGTRSGAGLPFVDHARFASAIGFTVQANACYTPEGFRQLLEANGPLWISVVTPFPTGPSGHAVVVTGMYKENGNHFVRITDPWDRVVGSPGRPGSRARSWSAGMTGSRYIMTWEAFAGEYESTGGAFDFAQLLHTAGHHGHTINRGSARSVGYAQALGDDASSSSTGDSGFGVGTSLTRQTTEQEGRRYDLAQLSGMVQPANALAGGAGTPALPGERVVLDDWPYIEGPGGRTQAGVAIDWKFQGGAVGDVVIAPIEGQVFDGWSAAVRADIARDASTAERVNLTVRVTTTFSRQGEQDQVAETEVLLGGDGRRQTRHGAGKEAPAPASAPEPAQQHQTETAR